MKTDKKILVAFLLNFGFALFELVGGYLSGSVAISSDALHDMGDAISIGLSYFLEKKSRKTGDERYSRFGAILLTVFLMVGSVFMIYEAIRRLMYPSDIHYDEMIVFAAVGLLVNGLAVYFTRGGHSCNQKAVNLHLFEDVLGWIVVLVGAIAMRFTDFWMLDPILSIGVAIFVLIHAAKHGGEILREHK